MKIKNRVERSGPSVDQLGGRIRFRTFLVGVGVTWAVLVALTPFTLRVQVAGFIPVTVGGMLVLGGFLIVAAAVWLNVNAVRRLARRGGVQIPPRKRLIEAWQMDRRPVFLLLVGGLFAAGGAALVPVLLALNFKV